MTAPGADHLSESEKQAANLAVSLYGVDRARLQQAFLAVQQAKALGQNADLLDLLVGEKLLTVVQANALREALDTTHLDPTLPPARKPAAGNGASDGPANAYELRQIGDYRVLRRL